MDCNHTNTEQVKCDNGPHYAKLVCKDCSTFIKWLPKPKVKKEKVKKGKGRTHQGSRIMKDWRSRQYGKVKRQ